MRDEFMIPGVCLLTMMIFASTSNVFADGTVPLPQTGQTKCYDSSGTEIACAGTGQDGDTQEGIEWPNPRFTNTDGSMPINGSIILDNLTGLQWAKDGGTPTYTGSLSTCTGGVKTWLGAFDYVDCLNANNYLGHNDWSVPNIKELESIVNLEQISSAAWLNNQGFISVQSHNYWSSSTYAGWTGNAYIVNMKEGNSNADGKQILGRYVWPVRSGQCGALSNSAICLPKTGQNTTYSAGDDGDLQKGITSPSPRFIDYRNDMVADKLTGLIWTKNANSPGPIACNPFTARNWQAALDYVSCLNANSYLGNNDWRLPNRRELESLLDYSKYNPSISVSLFVSVQSSYYWSSTTVAYYTGGAWIVSMWGGTTGSGDKDGNYTYQIWPVRSEQSGSYNYYCDDDSDGYISSIVSDICSDNGCVPAGCQTMPGDDCSDKSALVHPGTLEICDDGVDNDCDVLTDKNDPDCDFVPSGVFKLPDTGQTTCYNEYGSVISCPASDTPLAQDGSYTINPLSYTDNGNGTITDNNTGLMWQKQDGSRYDWYIANGTYDAAYNPSSQNICGSLVLGGYSDWRLPSKLELHSIVNYGVPDPGPKINTAYFPNSQPWGHWTATTFAGDTDMAWNVSFNNGGVMFDSKSEKSFIRCVRGLQLDSGKFTDNGDGTITDNGNGLMWQQGEPGRKTWVQAIAYCEGLSLGGHSDWRLPNFKELVSVTDDYSAYPSMNTSYFPNAHGDVSYISTYWSSTTYDFSKAGAYVVDFYDGSFYGGGKSGNPYVRCIRGGFDYYCDHDGDGYISLSVSDFCDSSVCVPAECQTTPGDDCNDYNETVNPVAAEICDDSIDNNCDGNVDDADSECSGANIFSAYDENNDWIIGDFELLNAIDQWASGNLEDFDLLALIDFWAAGCYQWDGLQEKFKTGCGSI